MPQKLEQPKSKKVKIIKSKVYLQCKSEKDQIITADWTHTSLIFCVNPLEITEIYF